MLKRYSKCYGILCHEIIQGGEEWSGGNPVKPLTETRKYWQAINFSNARKCLLLNVIKSVSLKKYAQQNKWTELPFRKHRNNHCSYLEVLSNEPE